MKGAEERHAHLLEVGDLVEVADVDDGEVLDAVGDACESVRRRKWRERGLHVR